MKRLLALVCLPLLLATLSSSGAAGRVARKYVIAMHCSVYSDETGKMLLSGIRDLSRCGITTLVIEVGYGYQWKSHPELSDGYGLSEAMAGKIAGECGKYGIDIVPEINCIGHQSWEGGTDLLLTAYPEFDETPGLYPGNEGIYCRSWCTSNEDVYPIVYDLIDEITRAFSAKGIHIGLDEIFLIGEDACPRCRHKDKAALLAAAINRLYRHCVTEKGLTLYMWGDRLIDGTDPATDYQNEYETSFNGTSAAVDLIPKDIIICDWHYGPQAGYGSIDYFLEKGFSVLPASYNDVDATKALLEYSLKSSDNPRMLGHLYTNWGDITNAKLSTWKPMRKTISRLR